MTQPGCLPPASRDGCLAKPIKEATCAADVRRMLDAGANAGDVSLPGAVAGAAASTAPAGLSPT